MTTEVNESIYLADTWEQASATLMNAIQTMTADGWTVTNQHIGPLTPPITDWLSGHHKFKASLRCVRDTPPN